MIDANSGFTHQVLIIGAQSDGDLIYLDTDGKPAGVYTSPESNFVRNNPSDVLEVISVK